MFFFEVTTLSFNTFLPMLQLLYEQERLPAHFTKTRCSKHPQLNDFVTILEYQSPE